MDPAGAGAEFHIPSVGRQHGGSYSCSYRPRSEPFVSSQPSDTVQLVVAEGTNLTQPGQMATSTYLNSTEPGGSGQSSLTSAGVSAAVIILLLLLLVAFVCVRKTRARRGSALRLNSTSPMGALKALAQEEHIYTSIDKGKKPQTPEPDSGADGLTYAELDGQALQGQRGGPAPAPEPAQTSEYAVINVSQGTPQ